MRDFIDLSGIFPPITTSFNADESINLKGMSSNLETWCKESFKGIVMFGSNGEFPLLSMDEKVYIMKHTKKLVSDKKILIAGSGCEGATLTIKLCNRFFGCGANAALIHTPCFYKGMMSPSALGAYYKTVADNSRLPIIIYNIPSNTGIDLDAQTIIKLSSHSNIIGLKDSGGNVSKLAEIVKATSSKQNFQVLAGSASFLIDAMLNGCVGGICALANILPSETLRMAELVNKGLTKEATELQNRLAGPNKAVTSRFGVPAVKHMLDKIGLYGGPTRRPLLPLTKEECCLVETEFEKAGYL